jgi:hypothetical protein
MRVFKTVGSIFFSIGLLLLLGAGGIALQKRAFIGSSISVTGEVVDVVRSTSSDDDGGRMTLLQPVVRFKDNRGVSHEFVDSLRTSWPRYATGDEVKVRFAPSKPAGASIDDFSGRWGLALFIGLFGTVFSLVGGGIAAIPLALERKRRNLKEGGTAAWVDFVEVRYDTMIIVNGRNPYRVAAQGLNPLTGKIEAFVSDPIWVDLTQQLKDRQVKVMIDPKKPSRHWIDLDSYVSIDT